MSAPRVTPFRAGAIPGAVAPRALPSFTGTYTLLADISEFQPDITDALYLAWSKAAIIRAMFGDAHDDAAWYGGQRRALLHAAGIRFLGIYQYIVASQSPVAQAQALARLLGKMQPGEKIIADIEEGSGSQQARWVQWADTIHSELGDTPWDYSGLIFAATHALQPVDWVAAYQSAEPSPPHRLWQFTDSYSVPGVGKCDCSVYHGSIDQLAALAWQPSKPAPAPAPKPAPSTAVKDQDMIILATKTAAGQSLTFTYNGSDVKHIVGEADQAALSKVLPVVPVSLAQVEHFNGGTLPPM